MRRRRTGRFENSAMFDGEDINPMDGMANLADVMLVFACGLMLALITYWNVDVSGVTDGVNADVGRKSSSSRREVKRTLRKMAANTKSTARSTATRRPASSTWWRTAMRNKVLLPALLLCLVLLLSACAKQADITDYEVVLAVCCGAEAASHPHPGGREQHVGVQRGSHRV